MANFLLGLFIGAIAVVVAVILVYKNNKKKINEALLILNDSSLTIDAKIGLPVPSRATDCCLIVSKYPCAACCKAWVSNSGF